MNEMQHTEKERHVKILSKIIENKKNSIMSLYFETQNLIMKNFFKSEFNNIGCLEDIKLFKDKLYDFKNIIGSANGYEFYNKLYIELIENAEKKKDYILENGEINIFTKSQVTTALAVAHDPHPVFSFIKTFFRKLGKVFTSRKCYGKYK